MPDPPTRPSRVGTIDGESTTFVAHHLDPDSRVITITVIQRGSRSLERLQRAMSGERITVTLPGNPHLYVTSPASIDVSTTGAGEQAFHRARLVLHLLDDDELDAPPVPRKESAIVPSKGPPASDDELVERLTRIEAKLDRLLSVLDRDANAP